ncbi:MAG: hypothetical protein KIT27_05470 [Legionellales bacterium]|nr:hypothetical protein [Legionellales bacterium]
MIYMPDSYKKLIDEIIAIKKWDLEFVLELCGIESSEYENLDIAGFKLCNRKKQHIQLLYINIFLGFL